MEISQNFVAFSEYINLINLRLPYSVLDLTGSVHCSSAKISLLSRPIKVGLLQLLNRSKKTYLIYDVGLAQLIHWCAHNRMK